MFGLDLSAVGLLVLGLSTLASFVLGRWLSRGWRDKRSQRDEAASRASESRQARRARERRERR